MIVDKQRERARINMSGVDKYENIKRVARELCAGWRVGNVGQVCR